MAHDPSRIIYFTSLLLLWFLSIIVTILNINSLQLITNSDCLADSSLRDVTCVFARSAPKDFEADYVMVGIVSGVFITVFMVASIAYSAYWGYKMQFAKAYRVMFVFDAVMIFAAVAMIWHAVSYGMSLQLDQEKFSCRSARSGDGSHVCQYYAPTDELKEDLTLRTWMCSAAKLAELEPFERIALQNRCSIETAEFWILIPFVLVALALTPISFWAFGYDYKVWMLKWHLQKKEHVTAEDTEKGTSQATTA